MHAVMGLTQTIRACFSQMGLEHRHITFSSLEAVSSNNGLVRRIFYLATVETGSKYSTWVWYLDKYDFEKITSD